MRALAAVKVWALVPAIALTVTGCGAEPRAVLRGEVEAVTLAANDGDADGVRAEVEDLLATLRTQVTKREIALEEADRIRTLALRIAENAQLLEPSPTPSPTPEQTEEPSPSPSPEETEEPEPSPSPEETEEPEPSPTPDDDEEPPPPIIDISPSPAQVSSQSSGPPSQDPSPRASA